jgi:hypothetical protein
MEMTVRVTQNVNRSHKSLTSPQIICHSTGETEYCTTALAIMAAAHLRKAFNKIKGRPSDSPLTIDHPNWNQLESCRRYCIICQGD